MYQKKKIAVFVSHIYGDYQSKLCIGLTNRAYELGYPVEIYTTNDGEDLGSYDLGEDTVLKIPCLNDIAGIVFASGTYVDLKLKSQIISYLKESKLPVVEVSESDPSFPCVKMENNETAYELTEHLIKVHNAKRICFLGHKDSEYYSSKREAFYKKALSDNNIPIGDNDVFICDGSGKQYLDALKFFTTPSTPDAIIAYNDDIALDFMHTALSNGYSIPNDFAITGCDETDGGQNITPRLTTVSFPMNEVGRKAIDSLVQLMNKENVNEVIVKAKPLYRESCGCESTNSIDHFQYLRNRSRKIARLERSMLMSMKLSTALSHATDIDSGCEIIADFVKGIDEINELYLCLYHDWNKLSSPVLELDDFTSYGSANAMEDCDDNSVILKLGIKNGKVIPECTFSKTSLLPSFVSADDNKAFLVAPLFFESRAFGYIAMSLNNGDVSYPFQIVQWITNTAQFVQNACEAEYTNLLTQKLEDIYLKDNLTGLLNRHGFDKKYVNSPKSTLFTSLIFFDLDHLKMINDTYGHDEGDYALKAVGQAMLKMAKEEDIVARFGGDEFYCIIFHDDKDYPEEYVSGVNRFLGNFSALSGKPYKISASSGYETIETCTLSDVSDLFKLADKKMYESKRNKRR